MSPIISRAGFSLGFGRRRGGAAGFSATGGTVTTYNGNTIHTFTSPGTFTVSNAAPTFSVEYVVVGGGGGTASLAGGGGAGGYITGTTPIGAGPVSKSVQVGAGGTGVGGAATNDGGDSYFGTPLTAAGGGGGSDGQYPFPGSGHGGGSGGGGRGDVGNVTTPGGSGNVYSPQSPNFPGPAPGQGYAGGSSGGPASGGNAGAGGGGAGGVGESKSGVSYPGGYGGIGIQLPATFRNPASPIGAPGPGGGSFWVAGGGGGNGSYYGTGNGGSGGGPGGPYAGGGGGGPSTFSVPTQGTNGTANTGGGAGGGTPGSNGGSGIVIIAYPS